MVIDVVTISDRLKKRKKSIVSCKLAKSSFLSPKTRCLSVHPSSALVVGEREVASFSAARHVCSNFVFRRWRFCSNTFDNTLVYQPWKKHSPYLKT